MDDNVFQTIETNGELSGDVNPTGKSKKPQKKGLRALFIALKVLLVAVFVCSISLSAFLIYIKITYKDPCFVNGMSMYPTLNADGYNANGRALIYTDGSQNAEGCSVDYGFTDTKAETVANLQRFDIVISYFPEDANEPSNFNIPLYDNIKEGKDQKIKRIAGLPGETVSLYTDGTPMGRLTVTDENGVETEITQPHTQADYDRPLRAVPGHENDSYPAMTIVDKAHPTATVHTWTLGKVGTPGTDGLDINEYLLLGDNRAGTKDNLCSHDSRSISVFDGAIPSYFITGKLTKVIGRCRVGRKNGKTTCDLQYDTLKMPWNWSI